MPVSIHLKALSCSNPANLSTSAAAAAGAGREEDETKRHSSYQSPQKLSANFQKAKEFFTYDSE
jgi:hypothetical protein